MTKMLQAREVAKQLGIDLPELTKLCEAGQVPGAQPRGRGYQIPSATVKTADKWYTNGHGNAYANGSGDSATLYDYALLPQELTTDQTAVLLRMQPHRVRQLVKDKTLESRRDFSSPGPGGRIMVPMSSILGYLADQHAALHTLETQRKQLQEQLATLNEAISAYRYIV